MVDLVVYKPIKGGLKLELYKDESTIAELAGLDWFVEDGPIFPEE